MELFLSQDQSQDKVSLMLEVFAVYIRAVERKIVNIVHLHGSVQETLKIEKLPLLVKKAGQIGDAQQTTNPTSIMMQIAKGCYIDDVLLGKETSATRFEVQSFIELSQRMTPEELSEHIEGHMVTRMFLVGQFVTAADIVAFIMLASHWNQLADFNKMQQPNCFRWMDHIQHLPGMLEIVNDKGLFISFPDENSAVLSKAQLKKLAKEQYAKDKKAAKKDGGKDEGAKKQPQQQQKQEQSKEESKTDKPQQQQQQEKKPKQKQQQQNQTKKGGNKKQPEEAVPDICQMDIRVGKILTCEKHPDSEKLYSETIDIGNGEIREIGSGLQQFISLEEMRGAMCIVLANLKPKKLAGKMSHGMVLCAETEIKDVVELIMPPEGSVPGDLISFEGFERKCPEALNAKKNPWDNVQPKLAIDQDGVAVFEKIAFKTDKGVCTSKTIKNGVIH